VVFRRRRSADDRDLAQDAGTDMAAEADAGPDGDELAQQSAADGTGPWDAAEPATALERADLGSLQVPLLPGLDIQLVLAEQHGAWVTVRQEASELRLQAFAAPKSGSLWEEVRAEIAAEITASGGFSEERYGTFGTELIARVPAEPGTPQSGLSPVRFVGVDGPRWFLRGLFIGSAAEDLAAAAPLEALMREIVVVRGDHPVPPRDLLELRLPPEAAQALAEEQARAQQEGGRFSTPPNPFERGPEFTETR
jgi:hypothetical protein